MTDPARVIHIVEDLGIVGLEKVVRNIVVTCDRARFHTRSLVHRKRQGNRRGNRGRWRQGSHLGHSPATLSGLPARVWLAGGLPSCQGLNRALPFLAELLTASHMRWLSASRSSHTEHPTPAACGSVYSMQLDSTLSHSAIGGAHGDF